MPDGRAPDPAWLVTYWSTTYGTKTQRFRLSHTPGVAPEWCRPGAAWALLTAHNPAGRRVGTADNRRASAALRAQLARHGLTFEPAINGEGDWQEPGYLVRGLGLAGARALGEHFGQLAVVWGVGARAALVPCRTAPTAPSAPLRRGWAASP